jgi:hypothetical protein
MPAQKTLEHLRQRGGLFAVLAQQVDEAAAGRTGLHWGSRPTSSATC